jgi:1-acyl-sn-glycerol-3-phosphate acyltransferase
VRILFRVKVIGKDNIPKNGRIIVCANHESLLDPVIIGILFPRPIHFMAKKELFKNKFLNIIITALGAFPVNRKSADLSAIRTSIDILRKEKVLGIFPEGKRIIEENIENAKPGIALITIKAKSPIVPVLIQSKYKIFSKLTIKIGSPIYFNEYYGKKLSTDEYRVLSKEVMKNIYSLKNNWEE